MMKKNFSKPTVVFVIGVILIAVGVPSGLYWLTLPDGESLGGVLILLGVFYVLAFVIADRVLIRFVRQKILNQFEIIVLIVMTTVFLYKHRTLEIKQLNQDSKFIILIENNGKFNSDNYKYKFPFNKVISTDKNIVVANNLPERVKIDMPASWGNSYYYDVYNYQRYPHVVLFSNQENMNDSLAVLEYLNKNLRR